MAQLVIGGSSGLGLSIAEGLLTRGDEVVVTGRHDPEVAGLEYHQLDLSSTPAIGNAVQGLVQDAPHIDGIFYAPGFYQEGTVTDLEETHIYEMLNVGTVGAILAARAVLKKQQELKSFVAITSTSQYTPRYLEPIYTAAKAGLGMFANSLSLDPRVHTVLVAAPAGMKTKFHEGRDVDMTTYLDPRWVAEQIINLLSQDYAYKYVKILRDPARVMTIESRN